MLNPESLALRGIAPSESYPWWCDISPSAALPFESWTRLREVSYAGGSILRISGGGMAINSPPSERSSVTFEFGDNIYRPQKTLLQAWQVSEEDLQDELELVRAYRQVRNVFLETHLVVNWV